MSIKLGLLASSLQQSSPLILDIYTGATAAYSLRKLRSAYTGNCIRVRRSSDFAQLDIGFSNNVLDTTTLSTFCGVFTGYVEIWYDQTGNGNNASAISPNNPSNPVIYNIGTLITQNGKPTITFQGLGYQLTTPISSAVNISTYLVAKPLNLLSKVFIASNTAFSAPFMGNLNDQYLIQAYNGVDSNFTLTANGTADANFNIINQYFTGSSISTFYKNNTNIATSTTGTFSAGTNNFNTIGQYGNSISANGNISELIIYKSNQLSNRTGINSNINSFYTIF